MDGPRECDSCGNVFEPTSGADPCPECGGTEKVNHVTVTCEENVAAQDTVKINMEKVLTGRDGLIYHSETNTKHEDVKEFVDLLANSNSSFEDVLQREEVAKIICSECEESKEIGLTGNYYRGRAMDQSPNPSVDQVTSPKDDLSAGRYSRGNDPVLYASRTERTAHIESRPEESETVWLLEFDIEQPELAYIHLDTDFEDQNPYLHHLLLLSEILPQERNTEKAYRPTQFLKHICVNNGISAIEYPSIRAEYNDNPSAVNIVVFEDSIAAIEDQVVREPYQSPCDS